MYCIFCLELTCNRAFDVAGREFVVFVVVSEEILCRLSGPKLPPGDAFHEELMGNVRLQPLFAFSAWSFDVDAARRPGFLLLGQLGFEFGILLLQLLIL
jgi:hypothetical protein